VKTVQQSLNAIGYAPWILHDYYPTPFNVGLAGYVSSGASLTWEVQYTCDPVTGQEYARSVGISQTTTVITVTDTGSGGTLGTHGLSVGDAVQLFGTGKAGVDGQYNVATVVDSTHYTLTSGTSQTYSSTNGQVITARVFVHPILTGQTGRAVSNYAYPIMASRLAIPTTYVSGVASLRVIQGAWSS
jgi:hypothetical protein